MRKSNQIKAGLSPLLVACLLALSCLLAQLPAGRADAYCLAKPSGSGGYCGSCPQPANGPAVACPETTSSGYGSGSGSTSSSGTGTTSSGSSGSTSSGGSGSTTGGTSPSGGSAGTGATPSNSTPASVTQIGSTVPTIDLPHAKANGATLQHILQIVFGIAGALALLFIVISGFRYILSSGDPQAVTKAKNGLIYAIVGLAVCILAEVLVTYVVGAVG